MYWALLNGIVLESALVISGSDIELGNMNGIWNVGGNERHNAPGSAIVRGTAANVVHFNDINIYHTAVGIADSGVGIAMFLKLLISSLLQGRQAEPI